MLDKNKTMVPVSFPPHVDLGLRNKWLESPINEDGVLFLAPEAHEETLEGAGSEGDTQKKKKKTETEPNSSPTKQEDPKSDMSSSKVEEQIDEAQGLLKSSSINGQSKEAKLTRVCAGLASRLQEYKSEYAQLEELLSAERELSKSCEDRIENLQHELSATKRELSRSESNISEALTAKNSEIESLVNSLDALKKQAASASLQALRDELALAERRAEEERLAHNATKKAAMEREVELEHRAVEASTALARVQRMADERAAKAGELEQKVALLEVQCVNLNQELQDMEGRLRREQKKSPEDANQSIQIQAWQQEVERARLSQINAENKISSFEAELQKMRVEMDAMKRDAEHYSRQIQDWQQEVERARLSQSTESKVSSLEAELQKLRVEMAAMKRDAAHDYLQAEVERNRISPQMSSTLDEDVDMEELELKLVILLQKKLLNRRGSQSDCDMSYGATSSTLADMKPGPS